MQTDNNHCLTTEGANQYPASTIEVVRSFISFLKFASSKSDSGSLFNRLKIKRKLL